MGHLRMINEEIIQYQSNKIVAEGGDSWATQPQNANQIVGERRCSVGQERQIKNRVVLGVKTAGFSLQAQHS